ncbi:MAG: COG1361 S-layer family protein [Candidatus Micrarchaeales archaeon]
MEIGKNKIGMVAAMFAAIGMLFLMSGIVYANGELSVTNLGISPQPVLAGQNFTLTFQLYDSYGNLQNINLGLAGSYPLLNYSPIDTQLISSMSQGLYGGVNSGFLKYTLRVPQNVQSGTYTLYVTATYLISTTVSGQTTTESATSNIPISFYISGTPNLVLTATPVTTIVPGSQSNIDINVFNSGTASATNVNVTLLDSANFTVSGSPVFNIGSISGGSTGTAVATIEANRTLMSGQNYIPVKLQYTTQYGSNVTKMVSVPISVIVDSPNLVPSIIASVPQTLYAGANQSLTVSIQNIGSGVAKNVTAKFLSTSNFTVGSSAGSVFIGTIQPGASATQNVFITANKDDNQTNYALPVRLIYSNANYENAVQKTAYLNVTLQRSAIYNITSVSGAVPPGATYVPLSFRIKNTGGQTGQQITFSLQSIYPITPASPNQYLTQLAPGQSANVTFYVNVDSQGNIGSYPVTLYEQWSQPNGATSQVYTSSQNYYAIIGTPGSSSGGSTGIIVAVIVIVILGVVAFRFRNRLQAMIPKKAQKKEKK